MADEIIRPRFGDPPVTIDDSGPHCDHRYVVLRKRDELVICRTCKREVSAFAVLCILAREWSWATYHEQEQDERIARIAELKKEEALVKARVRSAVKKAPEPRAKVFVEEALRRLGSAKSFDDLRAFDRWRYEYRWIEPSEQRQIQDYQHAARERIDMSAERRGHRRGVTVINGGLTAMSESQQKEPER